MYRCPPEANIRTLWWYSWPTTRRPAGRGSGVGVSHSSDEAGERACRADPVERRACRWAGAAGGIHGGYSVTRFNVSTQRWQIARRHEGFALQRRSLSVEEPDALIGHVRFCGGPSRVTARSTRPGKSRASHNSENSRNTFASASSRKVGSGLWQQKPCSAAKTDCSASASISPQRLTNVRLAIRRI